MYHFVSWLYILKFPGQELGYTEVDYNSNSLIGFSKMQANQKFGRRHSVATAYLDPASHRKNLNIVEKAKVTKVHKSPRAPIFSKKYILYAPFLDLA